MYDRDDYEERERGYRRRDERYGREGGYGSGREWEREDAFIVQRSQYGPQGRQEWGREGGVGRGDIGPQSYGRADVERERGWSRGGGGFDEGFRGRREWHDGDDVEPGTGETMYRPGMMRTSSHSETEYARGPERGTFQRGFWGQGGAGGEQFGGQPFGREYGRGEDLYREGDLTREGRQITSRQQGMRGPFTGRGPKGYQRSDDRIREDICEVLMQHGEIDASEVEIEVQNGEVTLRGTVEDRRQKRLIEDVLEEVSGVRDVQNQLRVQQGAFGGQGQFGQSGQVGGQQTIPAAGQVEQRTQMATGTTGSGEFGREAERAGTNARGSRGR